VPKDENLLGKVVDVVITSAGKHYLKCDVVSDIRHVDIPAPLPKGQVSGLQATPLVRLSLSSLRSFTCMKYHKVLSKSRGPIQLMLRDHGYGASASRCVPVYAPAFADFHYAYPRRYGQAALN